MGIVEKIKSYLARNWEGVLASLIATAIATSGQIIFTSFWEFTKVLVGMNAVYSVLLWTVFAVGCSMIIYFFLRLLRRIFTGNNFDIVIYPDLKLIEDISEINKYEYFQMDISTVKLWVAINNGNKQIYDCQVVLDNFEYCDNRQGSTWGSAYSGFDRKAMKWDVGYLPSEGKIELERNTNKLLEIAKATRKHPDINMKLSHLDGYSTRVYNLNGKYRATFRIDGKILVGNIKKLIKVLKYRVTFKYEQLPLLKIIEIEKIE